MRKFVITIDTDEYFSLIVAEYKKAKAAFVVAESAEDLATIKSSLSTINTAITTANGYASRAESDPTELIEEMSGYKGVLEENIIPVASSAWGDIYNATNIGSTRTFNVRSTSGDNSPGNLTFHCVYKTATNKTLWFINRQSVFYASNASTAQTQASSIRYTATVTSTFNGASVSIANCKTEREAQYNTIVGQNGTAAQVANDRYWIINASNGLVPMNTNGTKYTLGGYTSAKIPILVAITEDVFVNAVK
jgi:hypothetical protein